MNPILTAASVCRTAHQGQIRRFCDEPYSNHPARVASRVSLLPDVTENMVVAAYLHDVLEDTDWTIDQLLEAGFSQTAVAYVVGLTDVYTKDAYPKLNRAERKALEHERIAKLPPEVLNIKAADIIDNLRGQNPADPFAVTFLREKIQLLSMIGNKIDFQLGVELLDAGRMLKVASKLAIPKHWEGWVD